MINYRNRGKIDFNNYIVNGVLPHNLHYYVYPNGGLLVDKVILYENLDNELDKIFKELGVPFNRKLEVKAKSKYREGKDYKSFYNEFQKNLITDKFKKEIELHGYTF
jgi:hypothetical protein